MRSLAISTPVLIQLKIREDYHITKSNSDPTFQLLSEYKFDSIDDIH
jgi:hypothetical protein